MAQAAEQPATADSGALSPQDRFADLLMGSEQPEQDENEQDQPESEAVEQADEQDEQTQETAEAQPDEALEEVEFNGKSYKLPTEVKSALMMQKDYTQKTQELAQRKAMQDLQELQMQHARKFQQFAEADIKALHQLDAEIERYKQVDWGNLDTQTYIRTKATLDQLKESKQEVEKTLNGKRTEFQQGMQNIISQSLQKANEYLARAIPKWNDEATKKEITEQGTKEGFSEVELNAMSDPRSIKLLWKASQWDKLQSQKTGLANKVKSVPPVAKPGASVTTDRASELSYQKAMRSAKTSTEKAKVMSSKIADIFMK